MLILNFDYSFFFLINFFYIKNYFLSLLHVFDIFRDIATRNCLLNGGVVKLADFGMCRATLVYKIDLSKPQNVRWLAPEVRYLKKSWKN